MLRDVPTSIDLGKITLVNKEVSIFDEINIMYDNLIRSDKLENGQHRTDLILSRPGFFLTFSGRGGLQDPPPPPPPPPQVISGLDCSIYLKFGMLVVPTNSSQNIEEKKSIMATKIC